MTIPNRKYSKIFATNPALLKKMFKMWDTGDYTKMELARHFNKDHSTIDHHIKKRGKPRKINSLRTPPPLGKGENLTRKKRKNYTSETGERINIGGNYKDYQEANKK